MKSSPITAEEFTRRIAALLGGSALQGLPRRQLDCDILLKAMVLGLDASKTYSEREINDALRMRILDLWGATGPDHVTLRRRLVDAGHLVRGADGSFYRVTAKGPAVAARFEPGVDHVDVLGVLHDAREIAARRKKERGLMRPPPPETRESDR